MNIPFAIYVFLAVLLGIAVASPDKTSSEYNQWQNRNFIITVVVVSIFFFLGVWAGGWK
jgi:hypothetical protein